MYSLIVVFIMGMNPAYSRVVGSAEFRYEKREQCMEARERVESHWQIAGHRVKASCVYKTY